MTLLEQLGLVNFLAVRATLLLENLLTEIPAETSLMHHQEIVYIQAQDLQSTNQAHFDDIDAEIIRMGNFQTDIIVAINRLHIDLQTFKRAIETLGCNYVDGDPLMNVEEDADECDDYLSYLFLLVRHFGRFFY